MNSLKHCLYHISFFLVFLTFGVYGCGYQYHTYAEIEEEFHELVNEYPGIAYVSSLGKSIENRELWAIKISDNVEQDEDEEVVVLIGGHHGREWISVEVPFLIAEHLLESYDTDAYIKELVDNSEIWVVPLVNPDGHQHSVSVNRFWRKNRRDNGDGTFGVDLNRNYEYEWGGPGSSGDTFSNIYCGTSPFSEPETQAVRDFLQAQSPTALISYHSFGQLVMYPWGCIIDPADDKDLLHGLATSMTEEIEDIYGVSYTPQQSSALYILSGDAMDWIYASDSIPAFSIELRPRGGVPGFLLPSSKIYPTFEENLPAALFLIDWAITEG